MSSAQIDDEISRGIHEIEKSWRNTTVPKITTMTICVRLNNAVTLKKITDQNLSGLLKDAYNDSVWETILNRRFHNCIIVKGVFEDKRKITIKIFSNGKLHMTGSKSVTHAIQYGGTMARALKQIEGIEYSILDFSIQLANANCRLDISGGEMICLSSLFSHVKDQHNCILNNDVHAGLRIKFSYCRQCQQPSLECNCEQSGNKGCTIIVFGSGSILFNAFLSGRELFCAHKFISNTIEKTRGSILRQKCSTVFDDSFDYAQYI